MKYSWNFAGKSDCCWKTLFLGMAMVLLAWAARADQTFPFLEVGSDTYSNVTVTSKTGRYIIISHSKGLASIKLKELPTETLEKLGYKVEPPASAKSQSPLLPANIKVDPRIKEMQEKTVEEITGTIHRLGPQILMGICAGLVLLYFLFCYCSSLICKKTGQEPSVLIWIPILQLLPLLRAAGMSAWWILLWLLPVSNWIVSILWCINICKARAKSLWLALLLVLPITNVFAYLYLAFADGADDSDPAPKKITFH